MKRTNIYLSDEQMKRLAELSKRTMAPVAAIVRRAVDEYLKKHRA